MVRTIVSLDPDDKRWLDEHARRLGVSMTEVVRRAIRLYRRTDAPEAPGFDELLAQTKGVWKGEDGLRYQEKVRAEWDER